MLFADYAKPRCLQPEVDESKLQSQQGFWNTPPMLQLLLMAYHFFCFQNNFFLLLTKKRINKLKLVEQLKVFLFFSDTYVFNGYFKLI